LKKFILVALVASLSLTGCIDKFKKDDNEGGKVLKTVGEEKITEKEVNEIIEGMPANLKTYYKSEQGINLLVNDLAVKKMLKQEAKKEDIDKTDSYKKKLKTYKEDLLVKELVEQKINEKIEITNEELQAEYEKRKEAFKAPERVLGSHILIKISPDADKEAKAELKKSAKKILEEATPENFAELAKKHSQDSNAKNGGNLGWFDKKALIKEFSDVAFKAKKGKVHPKLIESKFGYHILLVQDKKDAGYYTIEEVQPTLVNNLNRAKKAQETNKYIEELKVKYFGKEEATTTATTEVKEETKEENKK